LSAALEYYEKAVNLDHYEPDAYINAGDVCFELGNFEKALKFYDDCIKRCPYVPEPFYQKAKILILLNRVEEAFQYLERSFRMEKQTRLQFEKEFPDIANSKEFKKYFEK